MNFTTHDPSDSLTQLQERIGTIQPLFFYFETPIGAVIVATSQLINFTALTSSPRFFPFFSAVVCSSLSTTLTNGTVVGNTYTYGQTVQFTCSMGYYITGEQQTVKSRMLTCQSDRKWNGSQPTCSRKSWVLLLVSSSHVRRHIQSLVNLLQRFLIFRLSLTKKVSWRVGGVF